MQLNTKVHTVFLLMGPSATGKSTFAKVLQQRLMTQGRLAGSEYRVTIISSDVIRSQLLQQGLENKMSPSFLEASKEAFDVLFKVLDSVTNYPLNHEFVILDTTGLDERFREQVRNLLIPKQYRVELIAFSYNEKEVRRTLPEEHIQTVMRQYIRLKRDVMPSLKSKDWANIVRVTNKSRAMWEDLEVSVVNRDDYAKCFFTMKPGRPLYVIGDVHESVQAYNDLVQGLDRGDYVFIGDYLDKGNNTREMLEIMDKRVKAGDRVLAGNHERYVYRALTDPKFDRVPEIEERYITSLKVIEHDEELKAMFINIFENFTVPFLRVEGPNMRTMYLTHAPCQEVYLGKMSPLAQRAQANLFVEDRENPREAYKFIFEEAKGNFPIHVFGHIAHNADMREATYKNKVFLDTGAVYGHKLTALIYQDNSYQFRQVDAQKLDNTDRALSPDAVRKPESMAVFNIDNYELTPRERQFTRRFASSGVRFISGTMSPAPANLRPDGQWELESLAQALSYFKERGISKVILEPKYMGSRCQFYLFNDDRESFAVSRGGFRIRPDRVEGGDINALLASEKQRMLELVNFESIIVDGELLPWSALGQELIEKQFKTYKEVVLQEINTLASFQNTLKEIGFPFKLDLAADYDNMSRYAKALSYFDTAPGSVPLEFKPFSILALNGAAFSGQMPEDEVFRLVTKDEYLVVDFDQQSWDDCLAAAVDFYNRLTVEKHMEGVVVKPCQLKSNVVPYMKVRNEEYLRLVYGYDYKERYIEHAQHKQIRGKLNLSLKEWQLGQEMLNADTEEILTEKVVKMLGQIHKERELDPRL